ncbi:MAG TPA: hypothetical protein VF178_11385 [Gemmatimonadaceae bacterium]
MQPLPATVITPSKVLKPAETLSPYAERESSRVDGAGLALAMVKGVAQLRAAASDSLESWRRNLELLAGVSKRRRESVVLLTQVLEALAARTDAEFHERVAALPVTISETAGRDAKGNPGVYRTYSVKGISRIRLFRPLQGFAPAGRPDDGLASEPLELEGEGESADVAWSSVSYGDVAPIESGTDWCEMTDEDYGYFEGECATQQEVDDAASILASMETDNNDIIDDVTSDSIAYCNQIPQDYEYCNASFADGGALFEAHETQYYHAGHFSDRSESLEEWVLGMPSSGPTAAFGLQDSCLLEGILHGAAVVGWLHSKTAAIRIILRFGTSAHPPAGAVAWAVYEAGITTFALAASAGYLIQCMQS